MRKIRDEADADQCLAAVRVAGGNSAAWAKANGVDVRSLYAWKAKAGVQQIKPRKRRTPLSLVELVPSTTSRPRSHYVLDVGGARVEFDDGFATETLQRVVRALRAC